MVNCTHLTHVKVRHRYVIWTETQTGYLGSSQSQSRKYQNYLADHVYRWSAVNMVQTASLIYINQGAQERWPDTTPPVLPTREYSYGTLRGLRIWSPDDGHWSMLLDDFLARSLTKVVPDDPLRTNRCRLYYAISSNNGTFGRCRKNLSFVRWIGVSQFDGMPTFLKYA